MAQQTELHPVVSFRVHHKVKELTEKLAQKENLDASAVHRNIFHAGLITKFGVEIIGNRMVNAPESLEPVSE